MTSCSIAPVMEVWHRLTLLCPVAAHSVRSPLRPSIWGTRVVLVRPPDLAFGAIRQLRGPDTFDNEDE
jgi:hypothetical protein